MASAELIMLSYAVSSFARVAASLTDPGVVRSPLAKTDWTLAQSVAIAEADGRSSGSSADNATTSANAA
jgi:hypothetical protein